jgi:hypothetical protein
VTVGSRPVTVGSAPVIDGSNPPPRVGFLDGTADGFWLTVGTTLPDGLALTDGLLEMEGLEEGLADRTEGDRTDGALRPAVVGLLDGADDGWEDGLAERVRVDGAAEIEGRAEIEGLDDGWTDLVPPAALDGA